jgi:hypothetical protein
MATKEQLLEWATTVEYIRKMMLLDTAPNDLDDLAAYLREQAEQWKECPACSGVGGFGDGGAERCEVCRGTGQVLTYTMQFKDGPKEVYEVPKNG